MSQGVPFLHSHSGLERDLNFPKHTVLVDAIYASRFEDVPTTPFMHGKRKYLKVNILAFVHKGGRFKNLNR